MALQAHPSVGIPSDLIEAIRGFPVEREVEHCGYKFKAPPFDFYATCPHCGTRLKLRSFSAGYAVEDVFDAVFAWLNQPGTAEAARRRQKALAEDGE